MSTGSADSFRLRGAFEGCISGHDSNISQRPYHKNCRCALHDKSRPRNSSGFPPPPPFPAARCNSVSYPPIRRSRSESSLAFAFSTAAAAGASPVSSFLTPSSSPVFDAFQISQQDDTDDLFPC